MSKSPKVVIAPNAFSKSLNDLHNEDLGLEGLPENMRSAVSLGWLTGMKSAAELILAVKPGMERAFARDLRNQMQAIGIIRSQEAARKAPGKG